MMPSKWVALSFVGWMLSACGEASDNPTSGSTEQPSTSASLASRGTDERAVGIAVDYAHSDKLIAGVAGGKEVVFVGQPLEGKIVALSRFTGEKLGELPPPPEGFSIPFIMHSLGEGRITVLAAGGLPRPDPFEPTKPTLHEFTYRVDRHHNFTATRIRDIRFTSVLVGFAEDFVRLDDGRYLLSDSILGSIWVVERDGSIVPGIVPRTFDRPDRIAKLAYCPTMPKIEVNGYPFLFSGSTMPGVAPLAVRDGTVYYHSTCARGLYSFPLRILRDGRPPYQRAGDIRLVAPTAPNLQVEELLDFTFNPYNRFDRWLYAADPLKLRVIRIDVETGRKQVVADDPELFDFPSSLGFLPPIAGISPLVVVSNQQERTPLTNDAVTETTFKLPFIVSKIFVGP
ncbi:hypothetical protein [Pendulispora albinea]|uniref:DUF4221 domain-containing protein n=1 Tax=Pendulispora albinea TaxID=2741071 RepID=A0ABZ2MAX3_9BACT